MQNERADQVAEQRLALPRISIQLASCHSQHVDQASLFFNESPSCVSFSLTSSSDLRPKFQKGRGGYTRIVRTRMRRGDAAEMALVEFVE
ncbi:MAG: hypothetical protein HYT96_02915 [Armatimonadetes bacterium]|nr:hypothetical protein [Armatimonadota bacterium]